MSKFWLCLPLLAAGCGSKKAPAQAEPVVGWHQAEGWLGACYFPEDFEALGVADRRRARAEALDAVMAQWKGERGDGIELDDKAIVNVETALLRFPTKLDNVLKANAQHCETAMTGGGTSGWNQWLINLPGQLLAGECRGGLDDTAFYYLDIGSDWQFTMPVCAGDDIEIIASSNDQYKVDDDTDWINAEGDPNHPTAGDEDYPCNVEGCLAGQLVMRFRSDAGVSQVIPVGTGIVFSPPSHGKIEVMVNDTSYYNNEYRVKGGIQHHTSITYQPVNR